MIPAFAGAVLLLTAILRLESPTSSKSFLSLVVSLMLAMPGIALICVGILETRW